jgi:signal transduction histidine kinase
MTRRSIIAREAGEAEALRGTLDQLRLEVEELRASRRRLVLTADAERRALERALHDGVQQQLVALAVDLQLADIDPAAAKALLEDVRRALDEAAELAERIYPPLLESGGLAAALRAAAVSAGVRVTLAVPAGTGYPPAVAGTVYRCCLEVVQRAGAGAQVTVTVRTEDGAVAFEIVDDRSGSDAGFDELRDRVEALGGALAIRAEPGRGTRVTGSLPLYG